MVAAARPIFEQTLTQELGSFNAFLTQGDIEYKSHAFLTRF